MYAMYSRLTSGKSSRAGKSGLRRATPRFALAETPRTWSRVLLPSDSSSMTGGGKKQYHTMETQKSGFHCALLSISQFVLIHIHKKSLDGLVPPSR